MAQRGDDPDVVDEVRPRMPDGDVHRPFPHQGGHALARSRAHCLGIPQPFGEVACGGVDERDSDAHGPREGSPPHLIDSGYQRTGRKGAEDVDFDLAARRTPVRRFPQTPACLLSRRLVRAFPSAAICLRTPAFGRGFAFSFGPASAGPAGHGTPAKTFDASSMEPNLENG